MKMLSRLLGLKEVSRLKMTLLIYDATPLTALLFAASMCLLRHL